MPRIIAISNLKGGSAKSTTAITMGSVFADLGYRTLIIDMDAQGHIGEGLGVRTHGLKLTMADVLTGKTRLDRIILPIRENLEVAPANLRLALIEPQLINVTGRELILTRALKPVVERYDYILIDCPPSVGIFTINAFRAASEVLVPMSTDLFGMMGVSMLFEAIERTKEGLEHTIEVLGILPTRLTRTRNAQDALTLAMEHEVTDHRRVFEPIPEAVAVREAAVEGVSVTVYQPASPASQAYRRVAEEITGGPKQA